MGDAPRRSFCYAAVYAVLFPNPHFGPDAQTPTQRARVLRQMQDALPALKTQATAHARQLYAEYVAGALSWADVRLALAAATGEPPVRRCPRLAVG